MVLRVGIIGARKGRHGIGEHVARYLAELGAQVAAVAGTSQATASEAAENLQRRHGILPRAYVGAEAMLAQEPLDAVAICSPERYHRRHLQHALEAGVHVLCEKPLVFEEGRDPAADAQPLIAAFAACGKLLMANEQWPYTLPYFERLFACDVSGPNSRVKQLAVWLSPGVTGPQMVPSALPHVLSLLLALAPADGAARNIQSLWLHADTELALTFDYVHPRGAVQVSAVFQHVAQQPRPAAYEIDGRLAHREIEPPNYQMYLEAADGGTRIALDDPLRLLLKDFLSHCRRTSKPLTPNRALLTSLEMLRDVYAQVTGAPESSVTALGKR